MIRELRDGAGDAMRARRLALLLSSILSGLLQRKALQSLSLDDGSRNDKEVLMPVAIGTRFNQVIEVARACGISVRYDYLHGQGGGACLLNQRPQLFVDLALDGHDQLLALEAAIRSVLDENWPIDPTHVQELEEWLGG